MDYKEKYEQALKRAKAVYHDHCKDRDWRNWLTELFPELEETESEDERIRREIIEYITLYKDSLCDKEYNSWIAWLEKQGEQESIDYNEELRKCRENPLYFIDKYVKFEERKPAWSKEEESPRQEMITKTRDDMTVELAKKDVIHLLRGVCNLDYETIFKLKNMGLGSYTGDFVDAFEWHSPYNPCWDKFSEQELYDLYIRIIK